MSAETRDSPMVVAAIGAYSPLGPTWEQTCASIRAGLTRFADHPYYESLTPDPEWDEADPLRCSTMPGPDWQEMLDEPERLLALVMEPFRQVIAKMTLRRQYLERGGIIMALPSEHDFPGVGTSDTGILTELLERTGLDGFRLVERSDGGQAGVFLALRDAMSRIRSGELDYCLVGGADSYFIDSRLERLDKSWRLRTDRNPDGFMPGEAAVLLLLTTPQRAADLGTVPLCRVGEVAVATEREKIDGERASTGQGLAKAIGGALARSRPPAWVLCDLNGESYRAFEWGLMQARLGEFLGEMKQLTHPADCLGDVGAATGALLVACAAHGFARLAAPEGPVLLWAGSDDGTRAALTVAPPDARERRTAWPQR